MKLSIRACFRKPFCLPKRLISKVMDFQVERKRPTSSSDVIEYINVNTATRKGMLSERKERKRKRLGVYIAFELHFLSDVIVIPTGI